MSIESEINRIKQAKNKIINVLSDNGAENIENASIDEVATKIEENPYISGVLPIEKGGTGADNLEDALQNLQLYTRINNYPTRRHYHNSLIYDIPSGGNSSPSVLITNGDFSPGKASLSSSNRLFNTSFNDNGVSLGRSGGRWKQLYAVTTSISTSDIREKKEIEPLENAKDFIMKLNPVSYKFIDNDSNRPHYGLIAQEVKQAMNECNIQDFAGYIRGVKEEGLSQEEATEEQVRYGLRYEEFIAPIIKTIQIQEEEIKNLKKEIKELKEQILIE